MYSARITHPKVQCIIPVDSDGLAETLAVTSRVHLPIYRYLMDLNGLVEHGGWFGIAMAVIAAIAVALIRRGVKVKIEAEIPASKR